MERSYYDRHEVITQTILDSGMDDTIVKLPSTSRYYFVLGVHAGDSVDTETRLEAIALKRTLNYLSPPYQPKDGSVSESIPMSKSGDVLLDPDRCVLVNMRGSVVSACFLIPSLMSRIESYLYAEELNKYMGTNVKLSLLVEAITLKQANHGCNYERLEYVLDNASN